MVCSAFKKGNVLTFRSGKVFCFGNSLNFIEKKIKISLKIETKRNFLTFQLVKNFATLSGCPATKFCS